jgi:hypothetical protein
LGYWKREDSQAQGYYYNWPNRPAQCIKDNEPKAKDSISFDAFHAPDIIRITKKSADQEEPVFELIVSGTGEIYSTTNGSMIVYGWLSEDNVKHIKDALMNGPLKAQRTTIINAFDQEKEEG